jgi:signal transduction histidine kinase
LENRLIRAAFTTERLDTVKLIAGQLAVSLDNAQLYAELIASRKRIVAAADGERRRIERNLHDGAQQRLVTLALNARAAEALAPADLAELREQMSRIASGLAEVSMEIHEISRGIHPAILGKGGLRTAIKELARRCPLAVKLKIQVPRVPAESIEIATYYLVAEALTNTAKHAHATTTNIHVDTDDGLLQLGARQRPRQRRPRRRIRLIGLKDRVRPRRAPSAYTAHPARAPQYAPSCRWARLRSSN